MPLSARFIHLASKSPRRRQLLDQIGVRHRLLPPGDDEDAESLEAVRSGEAPARYVQRVTMAKLDAAEARQARRSLAPAPILCADTTVSLGRHILGKPTDAEEARDTLRRLAGRTHRVITVVALSWQGLRTTAASVSRVRFGPVPMDQIDAYVRSGEPFGKAGAYAIQGAAAAWIAHIDGSHSGIMGLPLYETARLLDHAGCRRWLQCRSVVEISGVRDIDLRSG